MLDSDFLRGYQVQDKPEAMNAAKRKEARTQEKGIFANISTRIGAYLERIEEIFSHPDKETRERRMEFSKEHSLYPYAIVKPEHFPEGHFQYQLQLKKNQGFGEISLSEKEREAEIKEVIKAQKRSLSAWVDYFASDTCSYPADIKYFAMQGILQLGNFDTEKYSFGKRIESTTAQFAEIDREALSIVLGALDAHHHKKDTSSYPAELLKLISSGRKFGDMYASTMKALDLKANKKELLPITDGKWRTFEKGSNPQELVDCLAGKRCNLCIADIGQASRYLEIGSIEIYFSKNTSGEAVMPRIAIAVNDTGVYEMRGTYNKNEDIDPYISQTDILGQRMKTLTNGESYLTKDRCMQKLTQLYNRCFTVDKKTGKKTRHYPVLDSTDLRFLYELDSKIEGFGFESDPRIKEILTGRDHKSDISLATHYKQEEISLTDEEALSPEIKVHYGDLDLSDSTFIEKLPEIVTGNLILSGLTHIEALILPRIVGGTIDLSDLESATSITLPKRTGSVDLSSLRYVNDITGGEKVYGYFYIPSLEYADTLIMPRTIEGYATVSGLQTAHLLVLPQRVTEDFDLATLKSAEGLTMPEYVGGDLNLSGIQSLKGVRLETKIGKNINLHCLTSIDGLHLPENIKGYINTENLTDAEMQQLKRDYPHLEQY